MAVDFKKLSEVTQLPDVSDLTNLLAEEDGEICRVNASKIKGQGGGGKLYEGKLFIYGCYIEDSAGEEVEVVKFTLSPSYPDFRSEEIYNLFLAGEELPEGEGPVLDIEGNEVTLVPTRDIVKYVRSGNFMALYTDYEQLTSQLDEIKAYEEYSFTQKEMADLVYETAYSVLGVHIDNIASVFVYYDFESMPDYLEVSLQVMQSTEYGDVSGLTLPMRSTLDEWFERDTEDEEV